MHIDQTLQDYARQLEQELSDILSFWMNYTIDTAYGGFYGRMSNDNAVFADAPKGSVLNSRILWSFSAACNLTKNEDYLLVAHRAFNYFKTFFIDEEAGGVFWAVDHKGQPEDTKKQVYALAFAVYALSEYYACSASTEARALAINVYNHIIEHAYDKENGGYIEAFTRNWQPMEDMRLSGKDANVKKSLNTHLHVLEGFSNLYRIWPDENVKKRIIELVHLFFDHIIHAETGHLILFFDEEWRPQESFQSYGHDIEAAWLIQEAVETINDEALLKKIKDHSIKLTAAAARGLDSDGGLWYEYSAEKDHLVREKHWWPQAEAMVGFFNTWQITGDEKYLQKSLNSWEFVRNYLLNKEKGEWFWGVTESYTVMNEDKVGLWKCPYHNSRACLEIIKRIASITPKMSSAGVLPEVHVSIA